MYFSQEEFSPFKRWMSWSAMIKNKNSDDKFALIRLDNIGRKKIVINSKIENQDHWLSVFVSFESP